MGSVFWPDLRDMFFEILPFDNNYKELTDKMRLCNDSDAQILVSIYDENPKDFPETLRTSKNPIANSYHAILKHNQKVYAFDVVKDVLKNSKNHPLSQIWYSFITHEKNSPFLNLNDRDAIYVRGILKNNVNDLIHAFNLGFECSGVLFYGYATKLNENDYINVVLRMAKKKNSDLEGIVQAMFKSNFSNKNTYKIGKYVKSNICLQIYSNAETFMHFYLKEKNRLKLEVHTSSLCLLRFGIYKDLRIYIGKFIWDYE